MTPRRAVLLTVAQLLATLVGVGVVWTLDVLIPSPAALLPALAASYVLIVLSLRARTGTWDL